MIPNSESAIVGVELKQESIDYLRAVEIDVWLYKNDARLNRSRKPTSPKRPHESDSKSVIEGTSTQSRRRAEFDNLNRESGSSNTEIHHPSIYVVQIGKVVVVHSLTEPNSKQVAFDIAFYVNGYKNVQPIQEDWKWSQSSTGEVPSTDSRIGEVFSIWLQPRLAGKSLLLSYNDQNVERLLNQASFDGLRIELGTKAMTMQNKLQIWDQLKNLNS